MEKQTQVLTRGVYVAPWNDALAGRPAVVVIDRRGRCIHQMTHGAAETEAEALARAQALLDLLDPRPE